MEVLHFFQLFVKFFERVAGGKTLYLFYSRAVRVFVDIEESFRLLLYSGEEAIYLVVAV